VTGVSVGFRPPCWCLSRWAPTWRLHTNLYKFGGKASSHISHKKNCCDLNHDESLCIVTYFLFSDSGLYLLNGFDFLLIVFEWRDTENQHFPLKGEQAIQVKPSESCNMTLLESRSELKDNRTINFSYNTNPFRFFVLCILRLLKLKTEGQTIYRKPNLVPRAFSSTISKWRIVG